MNRAPPPRRSPRRLPRRLVVARTILCLVVIGLGLAAIPRIQLEVLGDRVFPEATMTFSLPTPMALEALTSDVLLDLEAAVRATGEVSSLRGSVSSSGADYRIRWAAGVDAEVKVARLDSELARLRSRLPEGNHISIRSGPTSQDDRTMVLWLAGDWTRSEILLFRDQMTALPAVQSVEVAGEPRQVLEVQPRTSQLNAADLERQLQRAWSSAHLGAWSDGATGDGKARDVLMRSPLTRSGLETLKVQIESGALVPLDAAASMKWTVESPRWRARLDGNDGRALILSPGRNVSSREIRASVEKELNRRGKAERVVVLTDAAEAEDGLLRSVMVSLVVGTLLCALAGGLVKGLPFVSWLLIVPVASSSALHAVLLSQGQLDVTTVPGFLLGVSLAPLVLASRQAPADSRGLILGVAASAGVLAFAVRLAGGALAPLLSTPVSVQAWAVVAASLAGCLPWVPPECAASGVVRSKLTRWTLKNGTTVVLASAVGAYALLALFGTALAPRSGELSPPLGDLAVQMTFGPGATLETAGRHVAVVEERLEREHEVEQVWSRWSRSYASLLVRVSPEADRRKQLERLARQLEFQLSSVPASLRVRALGSGLQGEPLRLRQTTESESRTDRTASLYRFVLRSSRLEPLRRLERELRERFARLGIRDRELVGEWGLPQAQIELSPLPGGLGEPIGTAGPAEIAAVLPEWRRRVNYPQPRPWPGVPDFFVQFRSPGAPQTELDSFPRDRLQQTAALGQVAGGLRFSLREVEVPPRVLRENGRFVLPLDLRMRWNPPRRVRSRVELDRTLASLTLPADVEVERPTLSKYDWDPERWQMFRIMATLPFLLIVLSVIWLSSLRTGLVAVAPGLLGVAAAVPLLRTAPFGADEISLLALGSALAVYLPLGWHLCGQLMPASRQGGARAIYRRMAPQTGRLLVAGACSVLPLWAAALTLPADRFAWIAPLRLSAWAGAVMILAQVTLLPVLVAALEQDRRARSRAARLLADPPPWRQSGLPQLGARSLTKIYSLGLFERWKPQGDAVPDPSAEKAVLPRDREDGFHALTGTRFSLEPGVVGLLGPNGSGKTTLLRLLCGLLEPSRGQIQYRGVAVQTVNLSRYRRVVGFLPQGFNAYESLTARGFLEYWALERGLWDRRARGEETARLLDLVGLGEAAEKRVRDLSGGMRRRLGIARALLDDPPILIVDEPTTGLDLESRNRLRRSLLRVAEDRVILFSTHIASDIAATASRVLVLHEGRLAFDGMASEFVSSGRGRVASALVDDAELNRFSRSYQITTRVRTPDGVRVRMVLAPHQDLPQDAEFVNPNLEESYLVLMGRLNTRGVGRAGHYGSLLDLEAN